MQDSSSGSTPLRVQFGCGLDAPDGWINYDASPSLRLQRVAKPLARRLGPKWPAAVRYGDVVRGLPHDPGTVDTVFSSHVLEHLPLQDFRQTLANVHRMLKPGGVFRSVLPDLRVAIQTYLDSDEPDAAVRFMSGTMLGLERRPVGGLGRLRSLVGNSRHLWMWDYAALAHELERAGFTDIRRAHFGDGDDPAFDAVEKESRWDQNTIGFHCRKAPA